MLLGLQSWPEIATLKDPGRADPVGDADESAGLPESKVGKCWDD